MQFDAARVGGEVALGWGGGEGFGQGFLEGFCFGVEEGAGLRVAVEHEDAKFPGWLVGVGVGGGHFSEGLEIGGWFLFCFMGELRPDEGEDYVHPASEVAAQEISVRSS